VIRGEVWWADFDPARGAEIRKHRPAVIMSATVLASRRKTIVAIPLSSSPAPRWPLVVDLPSIGGRSVAVCDQVRALDRTRFDKRLGLVGADDMERLAEAMRLVLAL